MVSCAQRSKRWSIKGKEFDTYKVGTVANSCSTMHKLDAQPISKEMFSWDNEADMDAEFWRIVDEIIHECERLRLLYKETGKKKYWRALIQLLPESWMQKRTVTLNYQVARAMFFARRYHKLTEWPALCNVFMSLPYGVEFIAYEKPKTLDAISTFVLEKLKIDIKNDEGNVKNLNEIWLDVFEFFGGKSE